MPLILSKLVRENCIEIAIEGAAYSEPDFDELSELIDTIIKNEQSNLILNLQKVKILNSIGINFLIKFFTKARNHGGDMYIVNISEKINQVLLLTKLNTVLNIATSSAEAEAYFN